MGYEWSDGGSGPANPEEVRLPIEKIPPPVAPTPRGKLGKWESQLEAPPSETPKPSAAAPAAAEANNLGGKIWDR